MNASELISESTTILSTDIKGIDALNLMQGEKTKHLPICDNKKYVAIISENDINDWENPESLIANHITNLAAPYVKTNQHLFEVINILSNNKLSLVPVVDDENKYLGIIKQEKVIEEISNLLSPIQFIKSMRDSNLNFFFVHISSISVTHGNDINPKLGEGNPINYYGLTKLKFESFLSRFMPSNSFIVLRPGAFYGKSYNNKNFDKFLDLIKRGIFIFPFKKRYRSYTNIDTIFSAIQIIINEIKE